MSLHHLISIISDNNDILVSNNETVQITNFDEVFLCNILQISEEELYYSMYESSEFSSSEEESSSEIRDGHWLDEKTYKRISELLAKHNLENHTDTFCIVLMKHRAHIKLFSKPFEFKMSDLPALSEFARHISMNQENSTVKIVNEDKEIIMSLSKNQSFFLSSIIEIFLGINEDFEEEFNRQLKQDGINLKVQEQFEELKYKNIRQVREYFRDNIVRKLNIAFEKSIPKKESRLALIGKLLVCMNCLKPFEPNKDFGDPNEKDDDMYYNNLLRHCLTKNGTKSQRVV